MPQMAPLMWLNLMFAFIISLALFFIINYFNFTPGKAEEKENFFEIEQKHWKW